MAKKSVSGEASEIEITLPEIKKAFVRVRVQGDLLVMHAFDAKAQKDITDKASGKAQRKRLVDVTESFNRARYLDDDIDCCLAVHFKKAMITAGPDAKLNMTDLRRQLYVRGDRKAGQYVTILNAATGRPAKPEVRSDWVRQQNGKGSTMAYRPGYVDWAAEFIVEFNPLILTTEQILNLVLLAGDGGIGEYRPQKSGGDWGRFRLAMARVPARVSAGRG